MNLTRPEKPVSGPYRVQFSPEALRLLNGLPKDRRDELTAYIDSSVAEDPYAQGDPSFVRDRRVLSVGSVTITCMVTDVTRMVTVIDLADVPE